MSLDYHIDENLVDTEEKKKAYIRGAFIGGGSISNPEKNLPFRVCYSLSRICRGFRKAN